jgi:hypothetical protein
MYKKCKKALQEPQKDHGKLRKELKIWMSLSGYDEFEDDDTYNLEKGLPDDCHFELFYRLLKCK